MADTPATPAPPAAAAPAKLAAIVDRWFEESFPNTALARNTECWNLVVAARDDLKSRIAKEG